jgi:hypothetical protein
VNCAATCSLVISLLATGRAADLAAQSPPIRGRVLRADGPVALVNVELTLVPSGTTTRSDALGYFVFRSGRSLDVTVSARLAGFAPATVSVRGDSAVAVEIRLVAIAATLDPIVTSVTRDARSLHDVGGAISVADSSAIAQGRTVGLHEVLRTMPGV